jgi:arabinogalactan oligomer/maltooligosaccharide transport system substrate-binding protein
MKKIIAMLLTVIMIATVFAACAPAQGNNGTQGTQGTQGTSGELPEVKLVLWGSEEDQELLKGMADAFVKLHESEAKITITLGAVSEGSAKDEVLNDVEAGPDVYTFAHDQIAALVNAGALLEIPEAMGLQDVKDRNIASSVDAATINGKVYAFPMTADNGYFMYYDKSVFTEEDVKSWEGMLAAAEKAGKKITMALDNAWYLYGFYAGAGLTVSLNADGLSNTCDWDSDKGVAVSEAIMNLAKHPAFLNAPDSNFATYVQDGTICAGINGTWNAGVVKEAWGENYGACKLPTFKVNGQDVQMGAFSGYKLVGVNPHSDNVKWAMELANFITNEQNQALRFEKRGLGPSNIKAAAADAVKADPALSALASQMPFCTAQNVGGNFWSPAATLGGILAAGNPDNVSLSELLKTAVDGIEAPPA